MENELTPPRRRRPEKEYEHEREHKHEHEPEHKHEHSHTHDHSHNHEDFEKTKKQELSKIIISAVVFLLGFSFEKFTSLEILPMLLFCISFLVVGFDVVKHAVEDVLAKNIFNECLMISLAALGAFAIREFGEGCSVMLLYSIGEYIHGAALSKSKKQIREIEAHDHGEHVHETSESETFIARFAKIYTPVICALALLIMLVPPIFMGASLREWIYRGLSALVIGCPCAIVISVPLAFSCAIDSCTKKGIYIYHSSALEQLHKNRSMDGIIMKDGGSRNQFRFARRAAKKAFDISRFNIYFALIVKAIVLVLAVFMKKELPMWFAAFSDVGISVIAILNSLRALKIR